MYHIYEFGIGYFVDKFLIQQKNFSQNLGFMFEILSRPGFSFQYSATSLRIHACLIEI